MIAPLTTTAFEQLRQSVPQPLKPALRRVRDLANGTWPYALADWRLSRTPRNPVTFNEKVRYRIAYDRRPVLTRFADKAAARQLVADRIGEEFLTLLHGVYLNSEEIPWSSLPPEYVCKATHGSGAVVIVWDGANPTARLPTSPRWAGWDRFTVRPEHALTHRFAPLIDKWMTLNYQHGPGRLPEWAYRDVPPRVLVEELLQDTDGSLPTDYKLFVFDGICRLLYVPVHGPSGHTRAVFRPDGTPIPVSYGCPPPQEAVALPENLPALVTAAEELGRGMDFVRVDLYSVSGRIVFGELTNYPAAGTDNFNPVSFDHEFGSYWRLPR